VATLIESAYSKKFIKWTHAFESIAGSIVSLL